jgi:antitoxin PrlF
VPSVTTEGQVRIPKSIRETLEIKPGDEVVFEKTVEGYVLRKEAPMTDEGGDPFEKYRGIADSGATMSERMRRMRGEYPRKVSGDEPSSPN